MLFRLIDVIASIFGLVVGSPVLLFILILGVFDTGSPLIIQTRVGRSKKPFKLVKFRTMKVDTAHVASHLAGASAITRLGAVLRKSKLDELPQLWNVLCGDMSLVGPRPSLFNQIELIHEREIRGVLSARPGITGLAQLSGIDMSTPRLLAETDAKMLASLTILTYITYLFQTLIGKGAGDAAGN